MFNDKLNTRKFKIKIFHILAECYLFVKVGGLADVVEALPKYQNSSKCHVSIVIPYYESVFIKENKFDSVHAGFVQLRNFTFPFYVQKAKTDKLGFELYLVVLPELFGRKDIYGYEYDI